MVSRHRHMRPGEWRWAVYLSGLVMAATMLPYVCAYGLTPKGHSYLWLLYNPDDQNAHLSWIRQACDGQWLLHDPYTTEPQEAEFLNLFMVVLGKAARVTHCQPIAVYHLARVAAGFGLLIAVYWLASLLSHKVSVRRLALLLTGTASGIGWAAPAINSVLGAVGLPKLSPPDYGLGLCMPEAITFLSVYLFPLFATSVLLLVLAYGLFLRAEQTGRARCAVGSGLLALVLGNIHTYDLFPFYLALLLWSLHQIAARRRAGIASLGRAAMVVVLSCPAVLYQYWVFQQNAVFQTKALTKTLTPPMRDMASAYGLLVPLALIGLFLVWRTRHRELRLTACWILATLVCLELPVPFQRKMAEGLHVPLCILAAVALARWVPVVLNRRRAGTVTRRNARSVAWIAALLLMVPSNVAFVAMTLDLASTNNLTRAAAAQPPYYLAEGDLAAIRWLDENTANTDVVLSAPYVGNYIPRLSGNTVYVGHWAETLHFAAKLGEVGRFYGGQMTGHEARSLMSKAGAHYVYYGAYERALAGDTPPAYPFLQPAFVSQEGAAVVYRVITADAP